MSDFLVENEWARGAIRRLGLPLPVPEKLRRGAGPWPPRPIDGRSVLVGGDGEDAIARVLARAIPHAGGEPRVADGRLLEPLREAGEAAGRLPREIADGETAHAIVFDATGLSTVTSLEGLHAFFHDHVGRLGRSGRIVVVARPFEDASDAESAAVRRALEGFVRSVAKEIGKKGATAHLLRVRDGAEDRVEGVLRFLLSDRSAFVSGQPWTVTRDAAEADGAPWTRPLDRKVAIVTGAARGIGAETARILAGEGAHVVCLDRPEDGDPATKLADEIGGSVLLADVAASASPERIAAALRERHGGVDVVVHNAGVTRDKTLARMPAELWSQSLDVNLGAILRIHRALASETLRDGGRVLCLSSIAGIAGNVGQTNYAASKAGLIGFVHAESAALAPRGITVNAVAPGFIETRMTAAVPFLVREAGRRLSALGQGGLPEDVGQVLAFLATPWSQGLTGRVIRICGGAYIGA